MTLTLAIYNNEPWHWAISGVLIGLMVPALLLVGNKQFGISSSLRHLCAIVLPTKSDFFNYNLKPHLWSFYLIAGAIIGSLLSWLAGPTTELKLGQRTLDFLHDRGLTLPTSLYPSDLFNLHNSSGIVLMVIGGFLIGFGTRWANGCTSGHSIFGIANLRLASIVATIAFFAGGLLMTHFLLPLLINEQ